MLKAIVFDFDGVIVDNYDFSFNLSKEFDPNIDDEDFKAHHDGNVFEKPRINFKEEDIPIFFEKYSKKIHNYFRNIHNEIETLSKDYKLFIISSSSEKTISNVLEGENLLKDFIQVLGVETHRSKIEKFNLLFNKFNLKGDECIFITDTLGDILEGNKVGVKSIAVDFGFHEKERLEKGNPFKIVSKFEDIRKVIQTL